MTIKELTANTSQIALEVQQLEGLTHQYRLAISRLTLLAQMNLEKLLRLTDNEEEKQDSLEEWKEALQQLSELEERLFGCV